MTNQILKISLIVFCITRGFVYGQEIGVDITIGKIYKINSKILNEERSLQVSLPSSYTKNNANYPVVFVLDGNMNFKFSCDIIRYLAANGLIPELIVVGIPSENRNNEFIPALSSGSNNPHERSGNADTFLSFIQNEVIPYIDKNYRTLNYKVIIGHSLGGLFVVHSLLNKPDIFDGYIAISPSLWWNNEEYLSKPSQYFIETKRANKILFVSLANESEDKPEFYNKIRDAFEYKKTSGFKSEVKFYMDKNHITTAVEATLDGIFTIFSPWVISRELMFDINVEMIRNHYKSLSEKLGINYLPPSNIVNDLGYQLLRMRKVDKAIEVFKYNVELYPNYSDAYDSLGEGYMLAGNKELAIKNYKKSLELNPQNTNAMEQLKKLKTN